MVTGGRQSSKDRQFTAKLVLDGIVVRIRGERVPLGAEGGGEGREDVKVGEGRSGR